VFDESDCGCDHVSALIQMLAANPKIDLVAELQKRFALISWAGR
jgi:hypothetical protein